MKTLCLVRYLPYQLRKCFLCIKLESKILKQKIRGEKMIFKNIETSRLYLRNISYQDRDFIYRQFSDDIVNRFLFDAEPLRDISEADEIINYYMQPEPRYQHRWILFRKTDDIPIGTCGFHCWLPKEGKVDIGYDLNESYWRMGYMTEAIEEIIDFSRTVMNVKIINACIYTENINSIKLVEKLGFKQTGTKNEIFRGNEYLHFIYTLEN